MTGPSAVLAIETSQRDGGVAVRDRGGRVHVEPVGTSHDAGLMPAIDRVYAAAGLRPRDTGVIGVSVGPGGFTGLRVAVATAKMLGEALGARLVAVPTALVVAEAHEGPGPIIVALASKGPSCWITRLSRGPGASWSPEGNPGLAAASEIDLAGVTALLGDRYLPAAVRDACVAAGVPVVPPRFDPHVCLAVTLGLAAEGCYCDPLRLSPIYARPPSAVELFRGGAAASSSD